MTGITPAEAAEIRNLIAQLISAVNRLEGTESEPEAQP